MATERAPGRETPSQTAGPFVHIGLAPAAAGIGGHIRPVGAAIAGPACAGERIAVEGRVIDGPGAPVSDVLIEIWQADAQGRYNHPDAATGPPLEPGFTGFGRVVPDFETGVFRFDTVKPGPVPGPEGTMQAPHLTFWLVARGINIGLQTRMYFGDETEANASDPLLNEIAPAVRRQTLIASRDGGCYRFDIHLQGETETVFLDI